MEVLISSPFWWKSTKICDFLVEAHNYIHEKEHDQAITEFKTDLDTDALSQECNLWGSNGNWKHVLGKKHYDIVTTLYMMDRKTKRLKKLKEGRANVTSAVKLLAVIRNKLQHNSLFEKRIRRATKWFRRRNKKWEFSKSRYASYWVWKFPTFIPFLWLKFAQFQDTCDLKRFYPHPVQKFSYNLFTNLVEFSSQLGQCLATHLEQGGVEARHRWENGGNSLKLEFKTFPKHLVKLILDGSPTAEMEVSQNAVRLKWYNLQFNEKGQAIKIQTDKRSTHIFDKTDGEKYAIFIGNRLKSIDNNGIVKKCVSFKFEKIIIITSRNNEENSEERKVINILAKTVSHQSNVDHVEMRVLWSEISSVVRERIAKEGKLRIQNKTVNLGNISADLSQLERMNLLSNLAGDTLKNLLRRGQVEILNKVEAPTVGGNGSFAKYIERGLYDLNRVSASILDMKSENDFFLISGITLAELLRMINKDKEVKVFNSLEESTNFNFETSTSRIFLVEGKQNSHSDISVNCLGNKNRLHYLSYFQEEIFLWKGTKGSFLAAEGIFTQAAKGLESMNEDDFIEYLENGRQNSKFVFIADKPGMGKSLVLKSLGKKIIDMYSDRFVFSISMTSFIENFNVNGNITKEAIETVILKLVCSNTFEEQIVGLWLNTSHHNASALKFEIMLDGLDEVLFEEREFAFNILRVFRSEFPSSVRVWVTLRDHMLEQIRLEFGCLGCKLEPFSRPVQINFLADYWLSKVDYYRRTELMDGVIKFAERCVKVTFSSGIESESDIGSDFNENFENEFSEIAGTPLICRIIAEIYEMEVLSDSYKIASITKKSLSELYEQFIERKFYIYLIEKEGLPETFSRKKATYKILREQMERSHIYFAINLLFTDSIAKNFQYVLQFPSPDSEIGVEMSANVISQGIVLKLIPLSFIHRTFAEYIVARFVSQVMTGKCLFMKIEDDIFQEILWEQVLDTIPKNIYNLEGHHFKFPALCFFLNAVIDDAILKDNLVSLNLRKYKPEYRFLQEASDYAKSHFENAQLFISAKTSKHANIIALLLQSPPHLTYSIFVTSLLIYEYAIFKHLIENYDAKFGPKNWMNLHENDENKFSILHWAVLNLTQAIFDLDEEKLLLNYIVQKYHSVGIVAPLDLKDKNGRTPYLLMHQLSIQNFSHFGMDQVFNLFVKELGSNPHVIDNDGNTILHFVPVLQRDGNIIFALASRILHILDFYCGVIDYYMSRDICQENINFQNSRGHTPLHSVIHFLGRLHDNNFLGLYSVVGSVLKKFKQYGADFNAVDNNGNTALHLSLDNDLQLAIFEDLVTFGVNVNAVNEKLQTVLDLATQKGRDDLVQFFTKQQ